MIQTCKQCVGSFDGRYSSHPVRHKETFKFRLFWCGFRMSLGEGVTLLITISVH